MSEPLFTAADVEFLRALSRKGVYTDWTYRGAPIAPGVDLLADRLQQWLDQQNLITLVSDLPSTTVHALSPEAYERFGVIDETDLTEEG